MENYSKDILGIFIVSMFVLLLLSKLRRYLKYGPKQKPFPKTPPQERPQYYRSSDLGKLRIIHETFQEFYPFTLEEIKMSFFEQSQLDTTILDRWLRLKEFYENPVPKRKLTTLYDRYSNLITARHKANREYPIQPRQNLLKLCYEKRTHNFLAERQSEEPFQLMQVQLSLVRRESDRMFVATSQKDQTKQIITIGSSDDREIKRLRDGRIWNDFHTTYGRKGIIVDQEYFLIDPVFDNVRYYTRHNVFCGMLYDHENEENQSRQVGNKLYHKYYFDLQGKLIAEDYGEYRYNYLPKVGVNYHLPRDKQIVQIDWEAFKTYNQVFSSSYYSIKKYNPYDPNEIGLVNSMYQSVLEVIFEKITLFENEKIIFGEKENAVYLHHLETGKLIRKLAVSGFHDDTNYYKDDVLPNFLRVYKIEGDETPIKYGVVNAKGEEVIPLVYAYVDKIERFDYLRVIRNDDFLGKSIWENEEEFYEGDHDQFEKFDEKASEWFDTYADDPWTTSNYITGTYIGNHWGIINFNNEVIIPPKYGWVEFLNSELLIVNLDGGVIDYLNWDKKEAYHILGGKFGVINLQEEMIIPMEYDVLFQNKNEIWAQKIETQMFDIEEEYDVFSFEGGNIEFIATRKGNPYLTQ